MTQSKMQFCAWAISSTNHQTKKPCFPDLCEKKGCDGFFAEGIKPECESFLQIPICQTERFEKHFADRIFALKKD